MHVDGNNQIIHPGIDDYLSWIDDLEMRINEATDITVVSDLIKEVQYLRICIKNLVLLFQYYLRALNISRAVGKMDMPMHPRVKTTLDELNSNTQDPTILTLRNFQKFLAKSLSTGVSGETKKKDLGDSDTVSNFIRLIKHLEIFFLTGGWFDFSDIKEEKDDKRPDEVKDILFS